jgi:hypothetical protein
MAIKANLCPGSSLILLVSTPILYSNLLLSDEPPKILTMTVGPGSPFQIRRTCDPNDARNTKYVRPIGPGTESADRHPEEKARKSGAPKKDTCGTKAEIEKEV